jgi:hypothetical protein
LIAGTTFFKNLILASGFESLKDSVLGSILYTIFYFFEISNNIVNYLLYI